MKRSLITGANGFVGANLARRLLLEGHKVQLLVRPGSDTWRLSGIEKEVELHELNLSDADALDRLIKALRPEYIFHLAAHGAYASQTDIHRMVLTNITGSINLVQSSLKIGFEANFQG